MHKLALLAWKRPWTSLVTVALVLTVAVTPSINLESRLVSGGFENASSESKAVEDLLNREFKVNPEALLIFGKFEANQSQIIDSELQKVLSRYGASDVQRLYSTPTSELLSATFPGTNFDIQAKIPGLKADIREIRDAEIVLTGRPVLNVELNTYAVDDALRAELFAAPILFLILLLIYRRLIPVLVTLGVAGVTLTVAKALGYLIALVWPTSVLFANIISMIGLAVSIDYVLFIYTRFREELSNTGNRENAINVAFKVTGRTVLYSALAVILGFSTLAFSGLMPIRSIGVGGVLVILVALLTSHIVLPAALRLLPAGDKHISRNRSKEAESDVPRDAKKRGLKGAILSIIALLVSITPLTTLTLASPIAGAGVMPSNADGVRAINLIQKSVPNIDIYPIEVVSVCSQSCGLGEAELLANKLELIPSVDKVQVLGQKSDVCIGLPVLSSSSCESREITHFRVFSSKGPNDEDTRTLVERLRELDGQNLLVGGAVATAMDFDHAVSEFLPPMVVAVLLLGLLVFALAFRSLVLGSLTLIINLLVVGASLGITSSILGAIGGGSLNSVTPLVLFGVIFGLTMDYLVYSVHLVQDDWKMSGEISSFAEAPLSKAARTITGAALLMLAVFLAFLTADLAIVRELGIGLTVGVILDAVVARKAILPYVLDRFRAWKLSHEIVPK